MLLESKVSLTARNSGKSVHISMEYPCIVRIDVYCQTLCHLKGRFFAQKLGMCWPAGVLRRGVARTGDAHAGSRGEGLTRAGQ